MPSARFSEAGYSGIVARAEGDDELVEILGLRLDLPISICATCCAAPRTPFAPGCWRSRRPRSRRRSGGCSKDIAREDPPGREFRVAEELVRLMMELNELDDAAVYNFAEDEEIRRGHRLARGAQRRAGRNDGAADRRAPRRPDPDPLPLGPAELADGRDASCATGRCRSRSTTRRWTVAERDYRKLSMETAQRTVRFWQLHNRIEK